MRPHAGTAAFLEALQAAMPAGRDRTPAPTMFFARLSVDDVTDDLDATAPPETSAGVLNLGTGARRVGLSNALAAGASAKSVIRRGILLVLSHADVSSKNGSSRRRSATMLQDESERADSEATYERHASR